MIVPMLKGGLCNQMFIVAAGYALSLRSHDVFAINYNLPHYGMSRLSHVHYKDTIYKRIPQTDCIPQALYKAPHWTYSPIPYLGTMLIDGYFQSEKHFVDYKEAVKNMFSVPREVKDDVNQWLSQIDGHKVSIHIRRGDYKDLKDIHPNIGTEYYIEAMKRIGNASYIICTDDWDSVSKEFNFDKRFHFSPYYRVLLDLIIRICLLLEKWKMDSICYLMEHTEQQSLNFEELNLFHVQS